MLVLIGTLLFLLKVINASERCVWVSGFVRCAKDPNKQMGVHVAVYDQDGHGFWQHFDKDDLMS